MTDDARCYALRRLNPFLGVTQIVELEIGRALSCDAVNWEIQLAVERPAGWGSLNQGRSERQFYRYGAWSEEDGLANFPVHPRLNPGALRESAENLVAAVRAHRDALPFALADRFELWLLDGRDEHPIALLAAVTKKQLTHMHRPTGWSAAAAGENTFESLFAVGPNAAPSRRRCERVEALVKSRAGSTRHAPGSNAHPPPVRPGSAPTELFPSCPSSSNGTRRKTRRWSATTLRGSRRGYSPCPWPTPRVRAWKRMRRHNRCWSIACFRFTLRCSTQLA